MIRLSELHKLLILFILLVLMLGGCGAFPQDAEEATPTPLPTPIIPAKPVYTVKRGEVVRSMTFTGRIAPSVEQELTFAASGRVASLLVKEGESVTQGQLLAELETGRSKFDLRRAQIQVEMAQLHLELDILQIPTWSEDYAIRIALAEKNVELAQLALDEMNANVEASQIIAPMDGTILSLRFKEGSVVEAYKTAILLADVSSLEVSSNLSESEMSQVQEGMAAVISPVSDNSQKAPATVRALPYPFGSASQESAAVDTTRITFNSADDLLGYVLGDLVEVTITLELRESTLWLPPQAIRQYSGRSFVIVQDESGQRHVDVTLGIEGGDRVEILDGLTEGQTVLAP